MTDRPSDAKLLIALAAKMTGAMSGAAVTLMTKDPFLGAGTNVALAVPLEAIGNDLIRVLAAERPKVRVTRAVLIAHHYLADRLGSGFRLRDDDFVGRRPDGRSAGEEVTEAALQAAMNAAQERKVDLLGYMLAYVATEPAIDIDTAHLLIDLVDALTFRSLMLLKVAGENDGRAIPRRPHRGEPPPPSLHPIMVEAIRLAQQGLVEFKDASDSDDSYVVHGPDLVDGGRMYPTSTGRLLFDALGLAFVDDDDPTYREVLSSLRSLSAYGFNAIVADGGSF